METIVHIVTSHKHTSGYIDFMNMCMTSYQHRFLIWGNNFELNVKDSSNVLYIDSCKSLFQETRLKPMLSEADVIVVSGAFLDGIFFVHLAFSPALLKKTVFHFWGGDFYCYREAIPKNEGIKRRIRERAKRFFISYCFKNCGDLVFLVPADYDAFKNIFKFTRSYSIAKMPGSPYRKRMSDFRNLHQHSGTKIILGNSATKTNCQGEILKLLHDRYGDEKFEVICPLSYGDENYKESLIALGNELLGEKFIPLTQFMEGYSYYEFLSDCDIGIFNNDRQQAMGNISWLLGLGKKVYIRTDTSMWDYFQEKGYIVFPVEEIPNQTFDNFVSFPEQLRDNNIQICDATNHVEDSINAWTPLLQNAISRNKGSKS